LLQVCIVVGRREGKGVGGLPRDEEMCGPASDALGCVLRHIGISFVDYADRNAARNLVYLELEVDAEGGEIRRFEELLWFVWVVGELLRVEGEDGEEGLLIANITAPARWLRAVDERREGLAQGVC
jgi:hypothetical protein